MDMVLTGRPVDAGEALRIGLADRVVPKGAALEAALELAVTIATFPQPTVRSDRMAMLEGLGRPLAEGLEIERLHGLGVLAIAAEGSERFEKGAGRHGQGIV
jgi:enoyl-CoA hydratase